MKKKNVRSEEEYAPWTCPECGAGEDWREYDQDMEAYYCGYCGWNKPMKINKRSPWEIMNDDDAFGSGL